MLPAHQAVGPIATEKQPLHGLNQLHNLHLLIALKLWVQNL